MQIPEKKNQIKEIIPKKYNSSNDLKKELSSDKSFIIIKQDYMGELYNNNSKSNGKEIKFKFENDSIIIIFDKNDKLNTGNNNGIIEKNKIEQSSNSQEVNPNDAIKFKKDLEILIRIFYYNKYLREKENTALKNLIRENGEKVYLINNSWMDEYKSFFDYQYLEDYLKNKNGYSEEAIDNIMKEISMVYIDNINKKNNFDKSEIKLCEKNNFEGKIYYFCNNHIINTKIYDLLEESGYKIKDSLINLELFFIGFKKILLFFPNKNDTNKYKDEIGFINEKGVFIPEYIIGYTGNNISPEDLNDFIMKDLINFYRNNKDVSCQIKKKKKVTCEMEIIGNCFKINNTINNDTTQSKTNEIIKNGNDNLPEGQMNETNINSNQGEKIDSSQNSLNNYPQQIQNEIKEDKESKKQENNLPNVNPGGEYSQTEDHANNINNIVNSNAQGNNYNIQGNNSNTGNFNSNMSGNNFMQGDNNTQRNNNESSLGNNIDNKNKSDNYNRITNCKDNLNTKNNNKIKLDEFMENQIKALISYHLIIKNLKESKSNSNSQGIQSKHCCLIDENWMQNYLNFFLYEGAKEYFNNIFMDNIGKNVEKIYGELDNDFLEKIKKKEKKCYKEISGFLYNLNKQNFIDSRITEDIQKYYNSKLYIITEEIYNYMNKTEYKLLYDLKKEYLINEGWIFIRIQNDSIGKYEILICNLAKTDNHLQPEFLLKYINNLIIAKDFDYLKKESFTKFKSERFSNDSKELINQLSNGFEKIGIIYHLKNKNLSVQINNNSIFDKNININNDNNNNIINNNTNNSSNNDSYNTNKKNNPNEPQKQAKPVDIHAFDGKKANEFLVEHILNTNNLESIIELKNILKGKNSNRHNLDNNDNNVDETKQVLEKMEEKNKFNEMKKTHVEIVLRLLAFEDKLYAKIKQSNEFKTMGIIVENGYIINHQIIDKYKEFYNSQNLKQLISHDINLKKIYLKYKNNKEYISEYCVKNFINEILENLPLDYVKEINSKNINEFLYHIENKELYRLHSNQQNNYYDNCALLNDSLGKLLLSKVTDQHIYSKFKNVKYMIANSALYLMLNDRIYCGYIDNKNIYIPEIIIYFSDEGEFKMLVNLLKFTKIDFILQETKIINNNYSNIGIYSNTNIKIIILNNKYTIHKKEETNLNTQAFLQQHIKERGYGFRGNIYDNMNNEQNEQNWQNNQIIRKDLKPTTYNQPVKKNDLNNVPIRKEIVNFIYIIIDMKKIIKKMKKPLVQNSQYEKYYIINFEWFLEYINFFNLYNLYTNPAINQTVEFIINNSSKDLSNEEIIANAKSNKDFFLTILNYSNIIKSNNFVNYKNFTPKEININDISFFNNIMLISETTMKSLLNYNYRNDYYFYCYFGESKIFVSIN